MVWFFLIVNFYFDYVVAAMLGAFVGFLAAKIAVYLRFLEPQVIMNRILAYVFLACFTLLLCTTYVATKTDPDFSVGQRYQRAFQTIHGWFWRHDPLLDQGGLENALRTTTDWVSAPEQVFYTKGNSLYAVLTNGQQAKLRLSTDGIIQQVIFSPDGKWLAVKTQKNLIIFELSSDQTWIVYDITEGGVIPKDIRGVLGGIQWSPDSRKICFFVQKSSRTSAYTNWFVYDVTQHQINRLNLGPRQDVFLVWAQDAQRLYFSQTRARENGPRSGYRILWFEIALASGAILPVADILSPDVEAADDILLGEGIKIYRQDKIFRFESPQDFSRHTPVYSRSGRRIYLNKRRQLCYQSAYGVRYCLFGLSAIGEYLTFPPKGMEKELLIRDVRWLPSEKYVLIKHYTHGLLVLQPLTRRIGVLAPGDVGLFGFYAK